ncbi:K+-transporting ATPase, KdpF subunit [Mycolicibacterium chubuense NBB4]|uniref:K+-transporting ATPase, KdpF subunit n=1 Tax=Mycolicibacterium chubuense (strain NBB4) TaxID=710421 RepID=I4BDF5_MYCCN|nr:K+-transporting ATPase, KdpF subunit [Mycolicibacterium chubuense NBB4]
MGRTAVSDDNIVGLVLSILVAVFLFAALLFPERF